MRCRDGLRRHGRLDGRVPAGGRRKGKRRALPNSEIMITSPQEEPRAATDIAIQAEHILNIKKRMNRILSERTGQPLEKIEADVERDFFMTAQAALEYGIVDEVYVTRKNSEQKASDKTT